MADDKDDSEKTEEPTGRRIQEAEKKGQVAFSREVTSFLMFAVLALNIIWFAPYYSKNAAIFLSRFIHSPHDYQIDGNNLIHILSELASTIGGIMIVPILATVFVAFLSSFLQNGFVISPEPISPSLDKISIMKGIGRLFSMRSLMEFIKGLIKISIIGIVSYLVVRKELSVLINLSAFDLDEMLKVLLAMAFKIIISACSIMFVIAVLDYLYQRFEYIKSLRMTKQELKDEFKQSEGDPQIKSKLRQIRQERVRKRMMAAVPQADVVIRNPTHYAVALQYDGKTMEAPVIIAMGQDNVALKIIEVAEESKVPVVSNPPLARALYSSGSLDEEIPLEHYKAVAEVIGYVYRLKGKKKAA